MKLLDCVRQMDSIITKKNDFSFYLLCENKENKKIHIYIVRPKLIVKAKTLSQHSSNYYLTQLMLHFIL